MNVNDLNVFLSCLSDSHVETEQIQRARDGDEEREELRTTKGAEGEAYGEQQVYFPDVQ